jgi:hypothetical protein
MISCNLKGGLGNQMFQIAATYAEAKRNNTTCCFDFNYCYTPNQGYAASKYRDNIFSKLTYCNCPVDYLLDGYYQSENYFKDCKEDIKDLFVFPKQKSINFNKSKPVVSVHVRRGDYLSKPDFHPTCSIEYYKEAMKRFEDCYFIIFSDDMKWCLENLKGENIYYYSSTNEIEELALMIQCDHNIIANSSFSWWGAYLNSNPNKIVIAPKIWYGVAASYIDTKNLLPKEWITI